MPKLNRRAAQLQKARAVRAVKCVNFCLTTQKENLTEEEPACLHKLPDSLRILHSCLMPGNPTPYNFPGRAHLGLTAQF